MKEEEKSLSMILENLSKSRKKAYIFIIIKVVSGMLIYLLQVVAKCTNTQSFVANFPYYSKNRS